MIFLCFSIRFWKRSDTVVVCFPFYYILELFKQCGVFFNYNLELSYRVVGFVFQFDFGNAPMVWYILFFYCMLETFRECGIFCLFSY